MLKRNNTRSSKPSSQDNIGKGATSRPLRWVIVLVCSLIFFFLTSPKSVPSVLLIAGFVMLGALLLSTLKLLLIITGLHNRLTSLQRRAFLLTGTVLPVILMMMQSIGQLTMRDILTLSGLFFIGVFYVSRARRS